MVPPYSCAPPPSLQDLWDGKASVLVVDPAEAVKSKIKALTLQKAEDIGLGAARTMEELLPHAFGPDRLSKGAP